MLIKLKVENFFSFGTETEFCMIPSATVGTKADHCVSMGESGLNLLRHGVIYGANASGKSNFVRIFQFIFDCVTVGLPDHLKKIPCKTNLASREKPTSFELQFAIDGRFYAYSFGILCETGQILEESLYELGGEGGTLIFQWEGDEVPQINYEYLGTAENTKEFWRAETYREDYGQTKRQLFLSFMNKEKHYPKDSSLLPFVQVYQWFSRNIVVCDPQTDLMNPDFFFGDTLNAINELIPLFDTGIQSVRLETVTREQLICEAPEDYRKIMRDLDQLISSSVEGGRAFTRALKNFYFARWNKEKETEIQAVRLTHRSGMGDFSFQDESDGTNRLFELLGILLDQTEYKIYIVDELERSLHPKLTEKFLELFATMHKNRNIQLIFTTHEATIMTLRKFRRDEIWFTEKDVQCHSHLFCLDRYTDIFDQNLREAYLEGRFGAVPVLQELRDDFQEDSHDQGI